MAKSPNAFRTISEVASWLGTQSHVLRFWESKFSSVAPVQRAGGRRYYRKTDMALLGGIKYLLHEQGMTIKAVQRLLKDEGTAHVQSYSPKINIIEESNISEKRPSEIIWSNSDKPIDFLNSFHSKKIAPTQSDLQFEPLENKDQPLLFPELRLDTVPEDSVAPIAHIPIKPSETTIVAKPIRPLVPAASLSKTDPYLAEFIGKIGLVASILKLSIVEQGHLVQKSTNIIIKLQHLQEKLSA